MIRHESVVDLQQASAVARAYAIADVSLSEFSARRAAAFDRDGVQRLQLVTGTDGGADLQEGGQKLIAQVRFEVSACPPDAPELPRVRVSGTFELEYRLVSGAAPTDMAQATLFARINGVYNAWPYIREIASNAFSRLGYPRLMLEPLVINARPLDNDAGDRKQKPPK